ncbi:MAG: hypothetical protein WCP77_08780 [Roseococcus sp.]
MIYLHVGLGKCGSSTIQHFASAQAEALRDAGLIYPSMGDRELVQHMEVGRAARQARGRKAKPMQPAMAALQAAMREEGAPSYLLSSESFLKHKPFQSARTAQAFRAFLGTAPVRVLAYIREYPSWVESIYAQKSKRGENLADMDAFIRHRCPIPSVSMLQGLTPWMDAFGAEHIRLRSLNRSNLVGGDLVLDLLDATGVHTPMPPFERVNESPHWTFLELARDIARRMPDSRSETQGLFRIWLRRLATDAAAALDAAGLKPGRTQYLMQRDWRALRNLYNQDVGMLNARLPGHAIPLLTAPEPPERGPVPSIQQVPEEVLDVYLQMLGTRELLKSMPEPVLAAVRSLLKANRRKARRLAAAAEAA